MAKLNDTSKNKTKTEGNPVEGETKTPTVSLILPFKDNAEFLPIMLHQIKEQNFSDFEAICVNDGSTDGSDQIIADFIASDPRFKVIENKGEGASAARNTGVGIARGKYIMCLGADDMINSDMVEEMVKPLKARSDVGVVVCDMDEYVKSANKFNITNWVIDDEKVPSPEPFKPAEIDNFFKAICGYSTNKMIRKRIYDKYGLTWQEIPIHDDMAMTHAAIALSKAAVFINKRLYHHRRIETGDAASESWRNTSYDCMFEALEEVKNRLIKYKVWKKYKYDFNNYALDQCRWKYFNVNEDNRQAVHDSLRNGWLERLGLLEVADEDFVSKADLKWMKSVLDSPTVVEMPVEELSVEE